MMSTIHKTSKHTVGEGILSETWTKIASSPNETSQNSFWTTLEENKTRPLNRTRMVIRVAFDISCSWFHLKKWNTRARQLSGNMNPNLETTKQTQPNLAKQLWTRPARNARNWTSRWIGDLIVSTRFVRVIQVFPSLRSDTLEIYTLQKSF